MPFGGLFPEKELQAIFYSFDADSSGEIDLAELEAALDQLGYQLPSERVAALFAECDVDGGGSIDYDEFKMLLKRIGIDTPPPGIRFAMELFRKYDVDDSGTIDKNEFKDIAAEIQADNRRRTILSMAAAATGALVVARYSDEYAFLQKTFRSWYLEPQAEAAQRQLFPTAMLSSDLDGVLAAALRARGYTPANTLFAHSVCSDEVNNKDEQLVDLLVSRWGEGFSLGGLAGVPFAGRSGFRAFLHHVPDSGRLLVLFAPHVGIDADGRVGALQRDGQASVSKACGAAVGAYKAIASKQRAAAAAAATVLSITDKDNDPFDPQLETIVELLTPRLQGIDAAPDPIAFVTYQMYAIVRDKLNSCIAGVDDVWDYASEVTVLGGVMINRHVGGDFFQPLSFVELSKDSPAVDLFASTFGPPPDLASVLGSAAQVDKLHKSSR